MSEKRVWDKDFVSLSHARHVASKPVDCHECPPGVCLGVCDASEDDETSPVAATEEVVHYEFSHDEDFYERLLPAPRARGERAKSEKPFVILT